MAAKAVRRESYKWPAETTRALIRFRAVNEACFSKSKAAPKKLWEQFIQEAGLVGKVEPQQASKKWENLKARFKELRNPKMGACPPSGAESAATWKFYGDMQEVLGSGPPSEPPLLVSPLSPDGDQPSANQLDLVEEGPSASSSSSTNPPSPASASDLVSTSAVAPPSSALHKRRKSNPILDFLRSESEREQRRHEENQAKVERFLQLFERMVDKM